MQQPILAIGPHIFAALPLALQRIKEVTKVNWPSKGRFGAGPARQFTGRGDDEFEIEGLYFDVEFGGHAEYLELKRTQSRGEPVELIGWAVGGSAAEVFGTVVILEVGATHDGLLPSGVGIKTSFNVKIAPFGDDFAGGLFG